MSNYGSKYKSYDEKRAAKKARTANHTKVRAEARKKSESKTKQLLGGLQSVMKSAVIPLRSIRPSPTDFGNSKQGAKTAPINKAGSSRIGSLYLHSRGNSIIINNN